VPESEVEVTEAAAENGANSPASTRRTRLDPEARRKALLDLGVELFGERPFEDIEVAEICERAGISRTLFYHYFSTKRRYLLAVIERSVALVDKLTRPDDPARPLDSMRDNVQLYFDVVRKHPHGALVAVQHRVGPAEEVEALFDPFRKRTHRMLRMTVGEENVDAYVDLAMWTWQDLVESVAVRLIDQGDVSTRDVATFTMLSLCNLLEEGFAVTGRPLPQVWVQVRDALSAPAEAD